MSMDLRVIVIGAGRMGADHIKRLTHRVAGAKIAAVVDVDIARAQQAAKIDASILAMSDLDEAFQHAEIDAAIIATPGTLHKHALLHLLERSLPILCEKPLTPDAASSWGIVETEQRLARKRIQVGFMRRFDAEYQHLRSLFTSGELGAALMLHFVHRNPDTPPGFTNQMLINDSVVHEFDAIRYLTGEEIKSVQVRRGRASRLAPAIQHDPQHVLIETEGGILADVEIFANAQYGYHVTAEAVFEKGVASIGKHRGLCLQSAGRWGGEIAASFINRFNRAYDAEVQSWVDAARAGEIGGPSAWDGYAAAACCEAGVAAQKSGEKVAVLLRTKPDLYRS